MPLQGKVLHQVFPGPTLTSLSKLIHKPSLFRISHSRPLFPCPNHPKSRPETTLTSQNPLKSFKLDNPKPVYFASRVLSHRSYNPVSCPCSPLAPSASYLFCYFPMWLLQDVAYYLLLGTLSNKQSLQ